MRVLSTLAVAGACALFAAANASGVSAGTHSGEMSAAMNADPDTENVLNRVKETLLDRMDDDAAGINVEVADGQVALSGCVDSEAQHDRAARVARDVENVARVYVDELEVCDLTAAAR